MNQWDDGEGLDELIDFLEMVVLIAFVFLLGVVLAFTA